MKSGPMSGSLREVDPVAYWGKLKDPHERECASAAIAARLEKARGKERREWIALRNELLGPLTPAQRERRAGRALGE